MHVHDVSAVLRDDLPHWPGDTGLVRTFVTDQARGDAVTVSHVEFGAHTGTHVDAPRHFLLDGAGVEALDLEVLTGLVDVVDFTHVRGAITADDFERTSLTHTDRVIAKTTNSGWSARDKSFRTDFVAFDSSAAKWCVEHEVRLLGIDYLSIEPFGSDPLGHPVHHLLLEAGVTVLEGLDLDGVAPGTYFLVSLPLVLPGSDGAPARTILIEGLT